MRRTQVDTREAPIRNLATNPSLRASAGTAIMRTNLVTHPNLESSGNQTAVRTNLCTNPRGVNTLSAYSGEVNQTITANVAITGHPEGLTTANRVSYTTGVNPGVAIMTTAVSGTQYTMSAWIYHETIPTAGSQGFAQAGVVSMNPSPAFVQGQWQRISWTHTASGTSHYGFRVSAQTGSGSFLITGILVEARPEVGQFFDAATPITNLCSNPSFTTGTTGYTTIGATLTRVTNQGGDGSVGELAQVAAGGTRQGVIFLNGVNFPAGTYTVAFDYKATDASYSTVRCFGYDPVTATIPTGTTVNIPLNKDGNFHRYVFTLEATAPFERIYMEALGTNIPLGTKTWIDRISIENGNSPGTFFEGQGDFNYVWSGTANASTSVQQAPAVSGWAQLGTFYTSPSNPYSGSRGGAIKTLGRYGDGIWPADMTITQNTTYTFSAMIKTTSTHALTAGFRWKDASSVAIGTDTNVTLTSQLVLGEWTRISATATSPAGAAKLQLMLRIYETHTPTVFYIDEAICTDSMTAVPYFDGGTPDVGDYIYDWTGAGHITTSVMKYTAVPGSVAARNSSAYPDSKFFCVHSTAEDGKKTAKWISAPLQGSSGWRVGGINTAGFSYNEIKEGKTYTLFMRYRTSGWATAQGFGIKISYGSGINNVCDFTASNLWPLLNQTGWQTYTRTFTALRDADSGQMLYIALPAIHSASTDGIFELSEWAIYEGEYTGDFIDGATPFSNWQGTADASTSIGYEPSLRDIGFPDAELVGIGDTGNSTVDPYAARTIYIVYESTDLNFSWQAPLYYARPSDGTVTGLSFQTSSTGDNNMFPRADFVNGTQNGTHGFKARAIGRHVLAMAYNQGLTSMSGEADNGTLTSRTFSPGDGWGSGRLYSVARSGINHIHTFVYYAEHDLATRKRISEYLGIKYGVNIP